MNRKAMLILLLSLSARIALASTISNFDEAERQLQAQRLPEAQRLFTKAGDEGIPLGYVRAGHVAVQQKKWDEAKLLFLKGCNKGEGYLCRRTALVLRKQNADLAKKLSQMACEKGDYVCCRMLHDPRAAQAKANAKSFYENACKKAGPKRLDFCTELAKYYFESGNNSAATHLLDQLEQEAKIPNARHDEVRGYSDLRDEFYYSVIDRAYSSSKPAVAKALVDYVCAHAEKSTCSSAQSRIQSRKRSK